MAPAVGNILTHQASYEHAKDNSHWTKWGAQNAADYRSAQNIRVGAGRRRCPKRVWRLWWPLASGPHQFDLRIMRLMRLSVLIIPSCWMPYADIS